MPTPEKGLLGRLVSAAWAVLLVCVLLWVAVSIFQQIFWWVVGLALLAVTVWVVVWVARWRRNRWLR